MLESKPPESRLSRILRTFVAFPLFLILSVILWQLVLGAWLLSGWFHERGWPLLGFSTKIACVVLMVLTILATLIVLVTWISQMIRAFRRKD